MDELALGWADDPYDEAGLLQRVDLGQVPVDPNGTRGESLKQKVMVRRQGHPSADQHEERWTLTTFVSFDALVERRASDALQVFAEGFAASYVPLNDTLGTAGPFGGVGGEALVFAALACVANLATYAGGAVLRFPVQTL